MQTIKWVFIAIATLFVVGCETATTIDNIEKSVQNVNNDTGDGNNSDSGNATPDQTPRLEVIYYELYQGNIEQPQLVGNVTYEEGESPNLDVLNSYIALIEDGSYRLIFSKNKQLPEEEEEVPAEVVLPDSQDGSTKKTGQIGSYDENGTEVSNIKDDGYYQAGVTASYSRSSDIVTDHVTNLMWKDDSSTASDKYDYNDALAYCKQDGWELPSIKQLQTIIDYSTVGPSMDMVFVNSPSSARFYWSKETRVDDSNLAFIVDFYDGRIGLKSLQSFVYVRCVKEIN